MPLFYFHIVASDVTLLDEDGVRCADRDAALTYAQQLMIELSRSRQQKDGTIVIENEDDGEMFEVPRSSATG